MRVALLGSRGYIGSHFVSALKQLDQIEILAPSRQELDLRDADRTHRFMTEFTPDLVINCAVKVTDIEQTVVSALNVIRSIPRQSLYFQVGSGAEYSRYNCPPNVVEPHFGTNLPTDSYGISKFLIAATLNSALQGRFLNLRAFGVFGEGEESRRLIPSLVNDALGNRVASISRNGLISYVSVNDLTRFLVGWIESGFELRGHFNFSGNGPIQLIDVLQLVAQKTECARLEVSEETDSPPYYGDSSALLEMAKWFSFFGVWSEIEIYVEKLICDFTQSHSRDNSN